MASTPGFKPFKAPPPGPPMPMPKHAKRKPPHAPAKPPRVKKQKSAFGY